MDEGHELHDNTRNLESHSMPSDKLLSEDPFADTSCGLKIPFRTKRLLMPQLQRFASPRFAVGLLSLAYFFSDGIANGVFPATISTVEKQFQLRTTEAGLVGAMLDVGACFSLSIMVYFGETIAKTQWMGFGMLCVATGSAIFVVPQYATYSRHGAYNFDFEDWNYCANVTQTNCESSPLRMYRYVLLIGTFFIGSGAEYASTIPISYLDENVKQSYSSLYHGILNGFGALGPATGYILGGVTLRIFNDPTKRVTITPDSSLWVGAWWICFVGAAAGLLLLITPVVLLPSNLRGAERVRYNREQKKTDHKMQKKPRLKSRMLSLMKNKLYILICISETFHAALIFGLVTYAVKIGVELYGMSESSASFVLGSISILSTVLGYFLGGALVAKFQLNLKGILQFMLACSIVSFMFSFGLLIHCPEKNFAIINDNKTYSMEGPCNSRCLCTTDKYNPVCDDQGSVYFSPCYAGCKKQVNATNADDCACVNGKRISAAVSTTNCTSTICKDFPVALAFLFFSFFGAFLTVTPSTQATLRSVRFDERTMAISWQKIIQIVFGRMAGRLVFAKVIDSSCLISSTECHERGACRLYDTGLMTRNLTSITASGKISIVFVLWYAVYLVRSRLKNETPGPLGRQPEVTQL